MRVMRNKYVPQSKCRKTSNHMFFRTVLRTMPILAHTIPWMNLLLICKGLSRLLWDYHIREFDVLFCTKVLYKLFLPVSPFCCQIILHAMRKTAYTLDSCHPYASLKSSIANFHRSSHVLGGFCWASEAWASLRDVAGVQSLPHWLVKAPESVKWVENIQNIWHVWHVHLRLRQGLLTLKCKHPLLLHGCRLKFCKIWSAVVKAFHFNVHWPRLWAGLGTTSCFGWTSEPLQTKQCIIVYPIQDEHTLALSITMSCRHPRCEK